jgi:hypothetical protein
MSAWCLKLSAFADGELEGGERDAFCDHLAQCEACQNELHEVMQLAALAEEARLASPPTARVTPHTSATTTQAASANVIPFRRRLARATRWAGPSLAAAAALTIWVRTKESSGPEVPLVDDGSTLVQPGLPAAELVLAPTRAFEGRLSSPKLDRHRPYRVNRGGSELQQEDIPVSTLAVLEREGDTQGLAGAYVLMGAKSQARALLEKLEKTPARLIDESAQALHEGKFDEALTFATQAMERDPKRSAAAWNRALALRGLGLTWSAAQAFNELAQAHEPGWSEEAKEQAQALDDQNRAASEAWAEVYHGGRAMMAGGPPLGERAIEAQPGAARLYFYHALRGAASQERVRELLPMAEALDRRTQTTSLVALTQRVLAADFRVRAPFAQAYQAHVNWTKPLAGDDLKRFIRQLDAAPARAQVHDIRLGMTLMSSLAAQDPDRLAQLIRAAQDPWFDDLVASYRAQQLRAQGKIAEAEAVLAQAMAQCKVEYRCLQLGQALREVREVFLFQRVEQKRFLQEFLVRARRQGDLEFERFAIAGLGEIDINFGESEVGRAFLNEALLRVGQLPDESQRCEESLYLRTQLVHADIALLRFDRALRTYRAIPSCEAQQRPMQVLLDLHAIVELARFGVTPDELARAEEQLKALHIPEQPKERFEAFLAAKDHLGALLKVAHEPKVADQLIATGIERLRALNSQDPIAKHAWGYLQLLRARLAAERNRPVESLAAMADELGIDAPDRCAIGLAYDAERAITVSRGPSGEGEVSIRQRKGPDLDLDDVVPRDVLAKLRPCSSIAVIARAPLHGRPLLPADMPWSFLSGVASQTNEASASAAPSRRVVVANPATPSQLGLAPLSNWKDDGTGATVLRGASATPRRVLSEIVDASEIEFHAHGRNDLTDSESSMLLLAPDESGDFALGAGKLNAFRFSRSPLIFLAACETTTSAPYLHRVWSLPVSLVASGARAVVASQDKIPDDAGQAFFDEVRRSVQGGLSVVAAVRDARVRWLQTSDNAWVRSVIVFESSLNSHLDTDGKRKG